MTEPSLWSFISNASPVVKFVILILLCASLASWTIILQRIATFNFLRRDARDFENHFWEDADMHELYEQLSEDNNRIGLAKIFHAGFQELQRLLDRPKSLVKLDNTQRAMRIATTQEITRLEKHLGFLATVGSTSPYVGLFGTVWGIMSAFRALGVSGQATIAMVAPGIAEALIATAIGLFAAIPAVIAYNRFSAAAERIATQYENFEDELATVFEHEISRQETEEMPA